MLINKAVVARFSAKDSVFFSPIKKVCQGTSTEVKRPGRKADRSLNLVLRRRMSKSVTPFPSLPEWRDDESQRQFHLENHPKHEDTRSGTDHVTLDFKHRGQAILYVV